MICIPKTVRKEIENDRQMERYAYILGLEDSVSLKWPFYPRQSTDSVQPLSNFKWHMYGNTKGPK